MNVFDSRMLLIIDEAHQCVMRSGRVSTTAVGMRTLDYIREIHDTSKCGVLLVGTNVLKEALDTNKALAQVSLRRLHHLQLPDKPTAANLREFSRALDLCSERPYLEDFCRVDLVSVILGVLQDDSAGEELRAQARQEALRLLRSDALKILQSETLQEALRGPKPR